MSEIFFYAHKIGYIGYDSFSGRHQVAFETVPAELVCKFLPGEPEVPSSEAGEEFLAYSRFYEEAKECFDTYGFENEEFQQKISCYLAEIPEFEVVLLIDGFSKAMQIDRKKPDWYRFTLSLDEGGPESPMKALCSIAPEEEIMETEYGVENFEGLSEEISQMLYLFYLGKEEELNQDGNSAVPETEGGMLGSYMADTEFGKVQVLYVGAGLCCRILDYTGNVVGYFDMGKELPFSAGALRRNSAANAATLDRIKQDNIDTMKQDAAAGTALTVIISHWHYDHVSVLGEFAREYLQNGTYAAFWANLTLICPAMQRWAGWTVTDYNRIKAALAAAHPAGLRPLQVTMTNQTKKFSLGRESYLYKGDTNFNYNPHNHGIAAAIRCHGTKNWIFLPGDCSYDTLSMAAGALNPRGIGYEYLVASHHGGTYTSNRQPNRAMIPVRDVHAPSSVVFSANGVAYGHPDPAVMADYRTQNWQNFVVLHQDCLSGKGEWYELL